MHGCVGSEVSGKCGCFGKDDDEDDGDNWCITSVCAWLGFPPWLQIASVLDLCFYKWETIACVTKNKSRWKGLGEVAINHRMCTSS